MIRNNSFYEDEVRYEFYVPGMVKRSWAAQLDVLIEIDRICRKYDIRYFADWGTLLGAVRHKGMIPWDDDMDIAMKRSDYNRFLEVAVNEFTGEYRLINAYNDHEYTDGMSRVVNSSKIHLENDYLLKNHQYPYSAGIDVFPLDYISRNSRDSSLQEQLLGIIGTMTIAYGADDIDWGETENMLKQIESLCGVELKHDRPVRQQLMQLYDRLSGIYGYEDADFITSMPMWCKDNKYKIPKECYEEVIYIPFEDIMVPVPKQYDVVLSIQYGDYMKYVKNGGDHEYPYYKRQEEILRKTLNYKEKECNYNELKTIRPQEETSETILFLPYKAENWRSLEQYWKRAKEDERNKVIVASIPYYHCGFLGNKLDSCDDIHNFPAELNVVPIASIDLEQLKPKTIYFQNPCDEYGKCITVSPEYYTSELRKYTRNLIYVPWFETDDFNKSEERSYNIMSCYCTMPGSVYADKIFVQSECMKETWIDKLTEWAGQDTRGMWENKIVIKKSLAKSFF